MGLLDGIMGQLGGADQIGKIAGQFGLSEEQVQMAVAALGKQVAIPPLLLIHGGRDHCRSWDWTAEALREDWHVIALDHRGHGDMGCPAIAHGRRW